MRIVILNSDYPRFLKSLYDRQPALEQASYASQMAVRNASLFGVANFYSKNFNALGHQAREIHVNNRWMQFSWARENGIAFEAPHTVSNKERSKPPGWLLRAATPFKPLLRPLARKVGLSPSLDVSLRKLVLAQIEDFKPDIVLNQDIFHVDTNLIRQIKAIGNPFIIGQVGIDPPITEDWSIYDLMISQLPRIVNALQKRSVRAEVNHLAFDPSVLEALPPPPEKDIDISFVGTVSADHRQRVALLEAVCKKFDLKLWGNVSDLIPRSSPLHRSFQGEVWGAEMYQVLQRSRITLNSHIDLAGKEAGNMRLFEATGVGAFLLTDFKDNLNSLFAPNGEVAVWHSVEDCLTSIDRIMKQDKLRETIALAGQARTLRQHTYRHRVEEILGFVGST